MARRNTSEQIIRRLPEAQRLTREAVTATGGAKQFEVSEQTLYRRRDQWGGMPVDRATNSE